MDAEHAITMSFTREGITIFCTTRIDERTRQIRDYPGAPLGDGRYELKATEDERRAILAAFCPYMPLNRSWIEAGEPEQWRLTLQHPDGCLGITIHLALRG